MIHCVHVYKPELLFNIIFCNIIYTDPLSPICYNEYCGSNNCPCNNLQEAFNSVYQYSNISNITILCSSGNYSGDFNSNLIFPSNYSISLISQEGKENTSIIINSDSFLFYFTSYNTSFSYYINGFTISGESNTINSIISLESSIVNMDNIYFYNIITNSSDSLISLSNSSLLYCNSCLFDVLKLSNSMFSLNSSYINFYECNFHFNFINFGFISENSSIIINYCLFHEFDIYSDLFYTISSENNDLKYTEYFNISNSIFTDMTIVENGFDIETSEIVLYNVSISSVVAIEAFIKSIYSSWDIKNCNIYSNLLTSGAILIAGYDKSNSIHVLENLYFNMSYCNFYSNEISVYPLIEVIDIKTSVEYCNFESTTDLILATNVLYQVFTFITYIPRFDTTLYFVGNSFINNTNTQVERAVILNINSISQQLHLADNYFLNNTGVFPLINLVSATSTDINNLTMISNSGGILARGSINIFNSYFTDGKSSVLSVLGDMLLDNVTIIENTNEYVITSIIEVGIDVSIIETNKSLIIQNSNILSNKGAGGIMQISDSLLYIINTTISDNIATLISGCLNIGNSILLVDNCNITNNKAPLGAFVSSVGSSITISQSLFQNNFGLFGGVGFTDSNSYLSVSDSNFHLNAVAEQGGVFMINGDGYLSNNNYTHNSAVNNGGVFTFGEISKAIITNSLFESNIGGSGGAVSFSSFARPEFSFCQFNNNSALSSGGVVLIESSAAPTFINCSFTNSTANSIGGVGSIVDISKPNFYNCTFRNNISPNEAGGLHCTDESTITINNSEFIKNSAGASGGAVTFGVLSTGNITNSIFDNNSATSKGGAIACYNNCFPSFENVIVSNNFGGSGAGLWITDSASPIFSYCLFTNNTAESIGGAILGSDRARGHIEHSILSLNTATGGAGGCGMFQDFAITIINNCTMENNFAQNGGAIFSVANNGPQMDNCTIQYNEAIINGGGIALAENCSTILRNINCLYNIAHGSSGCLSIYDISQPTILQLSAIGNTAEGFGGGITIGDKASPKIHNAFISYNSADSGGGLAVEQNVEGFIENSEISYNNGISFGGGILYQGINFYMQNITIIYNKGSAGGGICIDGSTDEFINKTACQNCTILYNNATNGGGIYVELSTSNEYNYKELYLSSSNSLDTNYTFINTNLSFNNAQYGGGIYYLPSSSPIVSFNNIIINNNIAKTFGGGIYIASITSSNSIHDVWLYNANYTSNSAFYGGYNVAWASISNVRTPEDFCMNCNFGTQTPLIGYSNDCGFATAPSILGYIEECPGSLFLDGSTFNLQIALFDSFGTKVNGSILTTNDYILNLLSSGNNCILHSPFGYYSTMKFNGISNFTDLSFNAKNGSQCALRITVNSSPILSTISPLNCLIPVENCPDNYKVIKETDYDSCQYVPPNKFSTTEILVVIIIALGSTLCCIVIIILITYAIIVRRRKKEYQLAHTEIPDFEDGRPTVTLQDILDDPSIPHIPYENIEFGDRLGIGGSGIVYSAIWYKSEFEQCEIALKELLLDVHDLQDFSLQEFLVEIKLMSALKHDNIVEFLGIVVSTKENKLYLVTELMHRGNLRDVLDKKATNLPWKLRLKLAKDAAKGMAYLHARKLIHRDLKPQNLLVNNNWCCKVADFGISTVSSHTTHMTCIGTPIYMAPEVLSKDKYSEKADVFSFGVLLVEIYTGRRPYTSDKYQHYNQAQLMYQIVQNGIRPDITSLPLSLQQLIEDCWSDDLRLRPSFTEIIVRLRRLNNLTLSDDVSNLNSFNESFNINSYDTLSPINSFHTPNTDIIN